MENFMRRLVLFACIVAQLIGCTFGQQQYFVIPPSDISVAVGQTAVISCVVGNRAGRVQWTKGGLTLGYDRSIPGIPRYAVLGSDDTGNFSLEISDVRLEDDADYECQVGPVNYNRPIRAPAHLTVQVPPSSINITGYSEGSRVEIKEHDELSMSCKVSGAKPKPQIVWFKNGIPFTPATSPTEASSSSEACTGCKTLTSTIKFRPTAQDNQASFGCKAIHPALLPNSPLKTEGASVILSVLYPPGPPEIRLYNDGETIRMGQSVTLSCISHGGNPLAQIFWYKKDGDRWREVDMSYNTYGRESRNSFTFLASPSHNQAKFRCEAKNEMNLSPMTSEIVLSVQFAPQKVTITGKKTAKVGETLNFECETGNSNPKASIQWVVDGRTIHENYTHWVTSPDGGWITKSNLSLTVNPMDRNKDVLCYAVNSALGETVVEKHTVAVLYAPGQPNITGLRDKAILFEGQRKRITCLSMAGNPLPNLKWFKGNEEITGTTTHKDKSADYSRSELIITANRSDNGIEYKCEAKNEAIASPLKSKVKLQVQFKPSEVLISVDPATPKAGKKATLTCKSGSSNPPASIVWRKVIKNVKSSEVLQGVTETPTKDCGEPVFGGKCTTNKLEINVTSELHGAVYVCEATNEELRESVHNAKTLSVNYKPYFLTGVEDDEIKKPFEVEEGKSRIINLTAVANPPNIEYKWSRRKVSIPNVADALPESRLVALSNGRLNISNVRREDAGAYKVKAKNSEGETKIKFKLNVLYAPSISEITTSILVSPQENAQMLCVIDANPIKDDTAKWSRSGFESSRMKSVRDGNTFYLTVMNVTEEDAGEFTCTVKNGIGKEVKNTTYLLVKHQPKMDKDPTIAKAASDKGKSATLTCRATGAPNITFLWSRLGTVLSSTDEEKYVQKTTMKNRMTWESTLDILNVTSKDYGAYDCIAQNEMGLARYSIYLNVTSRPDPPSNLKVLNITYNSVNLTWTPMFDGGFQQSYKIRYRKEGAENYQYIDVVPTGTNHFEVQDLKVGTKYSFSIKAYNSLGESSYTSDIGKVETKSPMLLKPDDKDIERTISRGIILTITLVAAALLILNVVLISFYVKRRAKKQMMSGTVTGSTVTNGITQRVRVAKHGIINETEVPLVIVVSVSVCATLLLLLNVVLLSYCHLAKKQRKRLERRQSSNQDTDSESKEIGIKKKINLNCVTSDTSESSRSCSTNSTSSSSSSSSSGSEETSKTPIDVIKPGSTSSQEISPNNTEGGSSTASTKSGTIEMYVGNSYNDTMSGETLSSISEKSESYVSANGHATTVLSELPSADGSIYRSGPRIEPHKHRSTPSYSHHSHTLQHPSRHRHHIPYSQDASRIGISSPNSGPTHNHHHMHLHPPTSIGHHGRDIDEEDEDLTMSPNAVSTYLIDQNHVYETRVDTGRAGVASYATMPRRPVKVSKTASSAGSAISSFRQHPHHRSHYGESLKRDAYIQSLGIDSHFEIGGIDNPTTRETDVDSVFHVNSGSVMGYRRTTDGGSEYNGLYVPPASESDYGYLSPPVRPPLPYLNGIHRFRGDDSLRDGISPNVINVYPEDEGHLV